MNVHNGATIAERPIQTLSRPFPVCISDSDCQNFAGSINMTCFGFICYPWQDDKIVDEKSRIPLCRKNADCDSGKECFRHHEIRSISKGLCFDKIYHCDHDDQKCEKGLECCGGICCSNAYFEKYRQLSCTTNELCQDLGLGDFCCPSKKDDRVKICCDNQPGPAKSNRPSPTAYESNIFFTTII